MLNVASKLYLGLAGVALVFALGYGTFVRDSAGVLLLVGLAVAAAGAGVIITACVGPDIAPIVPPEAPPPEPTSATAGPAAGGSVFSPLAALGLGLCAVGAAVDATLLGLGVVVTLAACVGWFGASWRDHPSWTPRLQERVRYRLLVPVTLPAAMLGLALVIAISVSRILLAVPEKAAVAIALGLAVALLFGFSFIASRPRVGRSALTGMVALAVVTVAGAGIAGAAKGERIFEKVAPGPPTVHLVAHNVRFSSSSIVLTPGEVVLFHDEDIGTFHNFAIYTSRPDGTQGAPVFNGRPIDRGKITYKPPLPPPGGYIFACDFHVNMRGTLTVRT